MWTSQCFSRRGLLLTSLIVSSASFAQEIRGSIAGMVSDPSGAPIADAKVTAVNAATGVATKGTSNSTGNYVLPYLISGTYSLTVERDGFEKLVRNGIEIRVADELKIDFKLTIGNVQQTVIVKEDAPIVESESADVGEVIGHAQLSDLPIPDGNPFILARLVSGTVFTGDPHFTRPFDNGDVSAIRVNGAEGGNDFTLNGVSNTGHQPGYGGGGFTVAYVPPADAVQEFKMTTSGFNARNGNTTGAVVNVSTKSGGNKLHGTLYEFFRNEHLSANDFFSNRAGVARPVLRYDRYGGSVGGPVFLPKLYDGRNRTFFFYAHENLPDIYPEPGTYTVPTAAERQGNFSALGQLGDLIYDPLTGVDDPARAGHVIRTPFPNNQIPDSRLSQLGLNYIKYYPLPDQPGRIDGTNNYYSQNSRTDQFHSDLVRIDHVLTNRQKIFGTYFTNWRNEQRGDWAGTIDGVRPAGASQYFTNTGGSLDDTITLSPSLLLDIIGGVNRFHFAKDPQSIGQVNPLTLGFLSSSTQFFVGPNYLPAIGIAGYSGLSSGFGDDQFSTTYSIAPTLTKVAHRHTLQTGYDFRTYQENWSSYGNSAGAYTFNQDFTKAADDGTTYMGQGLAALLLGQPTAGSIDRKAGRANQQRRQAAFLQDDWKATGKLTLNLGLRYEYDGATTERFNQNSRGFDLTTPNPVAPAYTAAFAKAFPKGLSVEGQPAITANDLHIVGGYLFPTSGNRGFWYPEKLNFMPRAGVAYQIARHTVLRGGWAIFSSPFGFTYAQNQPGYAITTQMVPSIDNGKSFQATFANPFPSGVANPTGSSLGLATLAGGDVYDYPLNIKTQKTLRWSADIQRELPRNWLLDVQYVGSAGYNLSRDTWYLNTVPRQYLSTSPLRDNTVIGALTAQVSNPLLGIAFPGTGSNTAKTVNAYQLTRPYPQFTGIRTPLYNGSNHYESGAIKVVRRFSRGYTLGATYTRSKLLEHYGFLNESDTEPVKQLAGNDSPNTVATYFITELPFGRGHRWGTNWRGLLNTMLGGWQPSGVYQFQGGWPLGMGDIVYFGAFQNLHTNIGSGTIDHTFDTSGFYFHDAAVQTNGMDDFNKQRNDPRIYLQWNLRSFAANWGNFRGPAQNNIDLALKKSFQLQEKVRLDFRADAFNGFNHAWFNNPNLDPRNAAFATITSQKNQPRQMEIAAKLIF
ncbi:MAG TPA: TonB-dependent receptor [Bryobacteraceae bacterium]|nr:TonB-dependent receptor [Bryobacteraceae bacterium]